MADLNRITHKYVEEETDRQIQDAREAEDARGSGGRHPAAGGDLGKRCDVTVGILAPVEDRVKRLIAREGITEEYARARIAAQKATTSTGRTALTFWKMMAPRTAMPGRPETYFRRY